mmetsp:Transcript_30609/g.70630  ORF Transcript_30609/g.70630 Transcript_30609/m.70630 type:complete len:97 (+) Transcript_30609:300-590(+)
MAERESNKTVATTMCGSSRQRKASPPAQAPPSWSLEVLAICLGATACEQRGPRCERQKGKFRLCNLFPQYLVARHNAKPTAELVCQSCQDRLPKSR